MQAWFVSPLLHYFSHLSIPTSTPTYHLPPRSTLTPKGILLDKYHPKIILGGSALPLIDFISILIRSLQRNIWTLSLLLYEFKYSWSLRSLRVAVHWQLWSQSETWVVAAPTHIDRLIAVDTQTSLDLRIQQKFNTFIPSIWVPLVFSVDVGCTWLLAHLWNPIRSDTDVLIFYICLLSVESWEQWVRTQCQFFTFL